MGHSTCSIEEYDPIGDTWTKKADMPTPRWLLSTNVVNNRIYAIGGTPNDTTKYSTVEEYDPASDKWTKKADMPTPRWGLSISVVNGKIYAIGGTSNWNAIPLVIMEEYDPVTDAWAKKADMPTARCLLTTSAVNGRIYAIGGGRGPGQGFSTVEEYDTGFRDDLMSVDSKGKLSATWGEIRRTK